MLLRDFIPKIENRELVRLYRIIHFVFDKTAGAQVKAYPPRPEHVLSFFPHEPETVEYSGKKNICSRCVLTGQHDVVFNRFVQKNFLCIQIVFQPAALFLLTGIPSHELRNQYLEGELFFSNGIKFVNEQLFHATSYDEMIRITDQFVGKLRLGKSKSPIDEVSKLLLRREGNVSLDWLAKQASLSIKQFERNFIVRTGITPKIFSRIARFDKAFRMKNQFPRMDWLSIAIACGYYDYQHLVKDYKEFTSLTPPEFHKIENKAPERQFGLHEGF